MKYQIKRVIPGEGEPTYEDVEIFEEKPAPAVTLGGRLLALQNETGFEHIAI